MRRLSALPNELESESALLAEGSEERARLLPLLVRLHLADCDGSLATLLERSAHVIDRKPEALPHV
jgi:hypothetical protein